MLSVPFALVGGVWLMWALNYNLSVAVAVGFIALAGVAAETGVIMLIYLDHALEAISEKRRSEGKTLSLSDLNDAIVEGAVERVRPKMMTVVAIMAGLLPIMWSTGTGSACACTRLSMRRPMPTNHVRQPPRVYRRLHERAVADLDVEHERVHARGQLLGHDARGDQRHRFHRPGHVAQRVELAVRRRQPVALADEAQPVFR